MTPSPLEPPPALLCHVTLLVHAVLTLQGGAGLQAEGGGGGAPDAAAGAGGWQRPLRSASGGRQG